MFWRCFVGLVLIAGTRVVVADPQDGYQRHVFFENSSSDVAYFHSDAAAIAPSVLDIANGRIPADRIHFKSPPNSLRLRWNSAPGGDWQATVKVAMRYDRRFEFDGNAISLWCYSEEGLASDDSPRLSLQDSRGASLTMIRLLADHVDLPPKKWVRVRLPFANFVGLFGGTEDSGFTSRDLASVAFVQGLDDGRDHTLYIDDVRVVDDGALDEVAPSTPTNLTVKAEDSHFDLAWTPNPEPDLVGYRIYRSWDGTNFEPVATRPGDSRRCVDFVGGPDKTGAYKVSAVDLGDNESALSDAVSGTTHALTDDQLLDMVQRSCVRYYWEGQNSESGMAVEILPGDESLVAVGASGIGVMALVVAAERHYVDREAAAERMLKIVRFLRRADRFHGAWSHFINGRTGHVNPYFGKYDDGGDLVETGFLIQGLLTARQYFDRDNAAEAEIRDTITALWREVEWDWYRMTPDSAFLYWHWSPDHGWHIKHPLVGWNETMIIYLLAIASPTHGVPASMYYSGWAGQSDLAVQYRRNWSKSTAGDHFANGHEYYGIKLDVGSDSGGELFFTQFSFLGFDPRGLRDRYTNYFENNRKLALINRAYCIDNPRQRVGYGANCWGRSAGIRSGGGKPLPRDDNGTICASAALGVFPYTPDESMAALKHFYRDLGGKTWGVYGFHDGFNETDQWYDEVYMGLNQAQIVVGIENYRTGLVWKLFMSNPEIEPMLQAIGFKRDGQPSP
jgi:exo beta-1,2-glucooligosaccharide sophorohydrolase (non-reducing end)